MKYLKSKAGILILSAFLLNQNIFSQNTDTIDSNTQEQNLPHLYTYINAPIVEQTQTYLKEEIENLNVENLTSFFQSIGIQILSYGAYGLEAKPSIRGFTDETVRVVIDGICVNNAQYGTFDFSTINISDIEKIQIVKGGFTEQVSDEGAVGGAIYITTKNQTLGHKFSTDSIIKTFFNSNSPLDTFSQKFGYNGQLSENTFLKTNLKGTFAQNKYFFQNYKNKRTERKNSQVLDGTSDIKLSHFFKNGNNWNISNLTYLADKQTPGSENSTNYGNQKDFNNNLSFNINFPYIKEILNFKATTSYLSNTRFYTDNTSDSKHYLNSFILSCSSDFFKFSFFEQSTGFTLNYDYLNSTDDGLHSIFSGSFKGTSKFKINKIFSISVPLAFKFSGKNFAFTPKLGFRITSKYFDFILNGYRMIQFPTMDDLYWGDSASYSGNPNLAPESGWGAEFSINGHNIFLPFSICFFTNYYKEKIQWAANSSGKWTPKNISSAFYFGIDFSFKQTFFKILTIQGNLEYLYNELLDKSNKQTYKKRIMWTPDFISSLIISLNTKYFFFSVETNYIGKKYTENNNISFVEPYFLINTSAQLNTFKNIEPYLRINNLLNTDYEDVPNYPMPGFSLSIGIKTIF